MEILTEAEVIGSVHITVYENAYGDNFFYVETDDKELLPLVDIIEDTLTKY